MLGCFDFLVKSGKCLSKVDKIAETSNQIQPIRLFRLLKVTQPIPKFLPFSYIIEALIILFVSSIKYPDNLGVALLLVVLLSKIILWLLLD